MFGGNSIVKDSWKSLCQETSVSRKTGSLPATTNPKRAGSPSFGSGCRPGLSSRASGSAGRRSPSDRHRARWSFEFDVRSRLVTDGDFLFADFRFGARRSGRRRPRPGDSGIRRSDALRGGRVRVDGQARGQIDAQGFDRRVPSRSVRAIGSTAGSEAANAVSVRAGSCTG